MNCDTISSRKREIEDAIKSRCNGDIYGYYRNITEEERKEITVLSVREMVNSILCYGAVVCEYARNEYFVEADKLLGKEKVNAIIEDQTNYFTEHAKVLFGVYEDSEGCTYNSIEWN